ncbi:unnamed protein product, partial [Polarella glacialis]
LKLPRNTLGAGGGAVGSQSAAGAADPVVDADDDLSLRRELEKLAPATVALAFLTAHGLVRLAPWLHKEWQLGAARGLRLITCVESLDSAVDFENGDLFGDTNELQWPVCRDLQRWGVFQVPPSGTSPEAWSAVGNPPLQLSRAEAEATQPVLLPGLLSEGEATLIDTLGRARMAKMAEVQEGLSPFDLPEEEAGFHAAAEAALHCSGPHRVLYLHSQEVREKLSEDEVAVLDSLESKLMQSISDEDSRRWGLLPYRGEVSVRSFEYHAYSDGGSVMDPEHRDDGSLLTLSVLLSSSEEFQGGVFSTFKSSPAGEERQELRMARGDGVLFVSEKRHNVDVVTGDRRALVIELWDRPRNRRSRHA